MAESQGGAGKAKKILTFTSKRAKRVQEKMMQKFGYADSTKDEVYDEFVANFNKQQNAANKLQKDLSKYMNALRTLSYMTRSLSSTLNELYEPEWSGHDQYKDIGEQRHLLWEDLIGKLTSKMVEPLNSYMSRFSEVKSRVSKRERKIVDYDRSRRELENLKTKQKVTEQKLHHSEEAYAHAKQLYDELTDDLYEELPTFYDSRIQFYASVFQTLASTEHHFHTEVAKLDESLALMMDGLASEAATGTHSTKKERGVDSAPVLTSRPELLDEDEPETETPIDGENHFASGGNGGEGGSETSSEPSTPSSTKSPSRTASDRVQKKLITCTCM